MRVNGAWIKRYCILFSKTYNTLHSRHNFPAGSREDASGTCICEMSLLPIHILTNVWPGLIVSIGKCISPWYLPHSVQPPFGPRLTLWQPQRCWVLLLFLWYQRSRWVQLTWSHKTDPSCHKHPGTPGNSPETQNIYMVNPWADAAFYFNTLRPRKMDAIFQTTFSNAFSSMNMYEFLSKFHWSLFLWVQLTIFHHWFR